LRRSCDCCYKNELSVELIAEYIHSTVLPKMVEEANGVKIGDDRYDDHVKELLKQHGQIDGSKDGLGIKQLDTSLKYLMANCVDFEEEESLLQSMGTKMGVIIDRTPKCHCELAGEGIGYSWGCAKNKYRRKPTFICSRVFL